ncbi:MAG: ribose 5-phosphate isomerase B [Candidatus Omnitrophica bacterium]|nr:ribose 5-phosphate isomerase B [Candidatus Omnitrophota bacterium]
MRIAVGSDHRGFRLRKVIAQYLGAKGHTVLDFGTFSGESCDYPVYCFKVAQAVASKKAQRGIFICKTGIGSAIALNKFRDIRAALVHNIRGAKFSRLHNDANVLVLGSDFVKAEYAKKITGIWLSTEFESQRHERRLNQIRKIEQGYEF